MIDLTPFRVSPAPLPSDDAATFKRNVTLWCRDYHFAIRQIEEFLKSVEADGVVSGEGSGTPGASGPPGQAGPPGAPGSAFPHAGTHYEAGSDPVDVAALAGYPGGTAIFLRADGTFAPTVGPAPYFDLTENAPGDPPADTARLHSLDANGFSVVEVRDGNANVVRLASDNVLIGKVAVSGGILRGQAVYLSGAAGANPLLGLAKADALETLPTLGLALDPGANNDFIRVLLGGTLQLLNTSAFAEGARVFVSPTTAGGLTTTLPVAPAYSQRVGVVTRSHATQGEVVVVTTGIDGPPRLHGETHDVGGTDPVTVTDLAGYPGGTTTFLRADGTFAAASGSGLPDGDAGDIVVSGGGTVLTIQDGAVTGAKMRDSLPVSIMGRPMNTNGPPVDIRPDFGVAATQLFIYDNNIPALRFIPASAIGLLGSNSETFQVVEVVAPLVLAGDLLERLEFDATAVLDNNGRVAVRKNTGADVGTRRRINFIEGSNVTLTVADDAAGEEVDVTIAASGGGGGTSAAVIGTSRALVLQNNATTPDSQVDITADEVVLKDGSGTIYLASAVNVTVNMGGTVGTANALDAGVNTSNTWYYVWLIYNGTAVASLLSVSATAPTMPAGYTFKARVGVVRNDGSAHFVRFFQTGQRCSVAETNIFTAKTATTANTYQVLAAADLTNFRAAVPPIAVACAGSIGSSSNNAGEVTIAACGSTGAVDAAGIGAINAVMSVAPGVFNTFFTSSPFDVSVRGGTANYNLQWRAFNNAVQHRLNISGFTLP